MNTRIPAILHLSALVGISLLLAALPAHAKLIVGENFNSYPEGLLKDVGSTPWNASTQVWVTADGSNGNFAEIRSSGDTSKQRSDRTFSNIPISGTYWVQYDVQATFTNANQTGAAEHAQIRFSDGVNDVINIYLRSNESVFRYTCGTTTSNTTISYVNTGWHTFTYEINLETKTGTIYLDGQSIVSSFSFTGTNTFNTLTFRGNIVTPGTALRVDNIGFYDTNPLAPIPEPATYATLGGILVLAFGMIATRRRA